MTLRYPMAPKLARTSTISKVPIALSLCTVSDVHVGCSINFLISIHFFFAGMLADREKFGVGKALFLREFGRTAAYYTNASFVPNFIREPRDFLPPNRTEDIERASDLCGESYQCRYDYGMSLSREMAFFTKIYYDHAVNIKATNDHRVISCGVLETPRFGRKLSFLFTPGSQVGFECNEGFVLTGDRRRTCTAAGKWDPPVYGYTECLREFKCFFSLSLAILHRY